MTAKGKPSESRPAKVKTKTRKPHPEATAPAPEPLDIARLIDENRHVPPSGTARKPAGEVLRFDPATRPWDWLGDFVKALRQIAESLVYPAPAKERGSERWGQLELAHAYWGSVVHEIRSLLREVQSQRGQVFGASCFEAARPTLVGAVQILAGVCDEWQERDARWRNFLDQLELCDDETLDKALSLELRRFDDYLKESMVVSRLKEAAAALDTHWVFLQGLKAEEDTSPTLDSGATADTPATTPPSTSVATGAGTGGNGQEAAKPHATAKRARAGKRKKKQPRRKRPSGVKLADPPTGGPSANGRGKPWDGTNPAFILISKAVEKYCDGPNVPALGTLSRTHCRPDGEFDYMRKGQRCKVHEEQFVAYAGRQGWTKDAVRNAEALVEAYKNSPQGRQEALKKKWEMDWKNVR